MNNFLKNRLQFLDLVWLLIKSPVYKVANFVTAANTTDK